MSLNNLKRPEGGYKKKKRVGRGVGSGHGKTSTRGHKGAGARSGADKGPGFEGGQMPLTRKIPKRGFFNPFKEQFSLVNIESLNSFEPNTVIDREILLKNRIIRKKGLAIKVLGGGELKKALTVKADKFSASAKSKIEAAGGKAETV